MRIVLVYSALTIRGELKVNGGALPAGLSFHVVAHRVDQPTQRPLMAQVDARGQFLIEGAPQGEYEISVSPNFAPYIEPLDQQTMRLISLVKERVVVAGADPQTVVLVIDLSRKEGDR